MAQGMAMMGGGAGAEATYANAEGMTVTLSAYADNMMVQSFAPILSDPQMVAMMGTVEKEEPIPMVMSRPTSSIRKAASPL